MLFMVIEHFIGGCPSAVRERFLLKGRMLPDGVTYHVSWVDPVNAKCFQVMEADSRDALRRWTERWEDLVEFEIVPVLSSEEYWRSVPGA